MSQVQTGTISTKVPARLESKPPWPRGPSSSSCPPAARAGMSRLLGAVSQYVLRYAPCPVLVVPDASKDL
jgi:Universal stress protein family